MDYKAWLNDVVKRRVVTDAKAKSDLEKVAAQEDLTLPVLMELLGAGYDVVVWDSGASTHGKCIELNKQQWMLEDFVSGLQHSAPMAERSHPNDKNCRLIVMGPGLPSYRVDYFGNMEETE